MGIEPSPKFGNLLDLLSSTRKRLYLANREPQTGFGQTRPASWYSKEHEEKVMICKLGDVYWYKFMWQGKLTLTTNQVSNFLQIGFHTDQ